MNFTTAISTPFALTQKSADKTADSIRPQAVGLIATARKALAIFMAILSFPVSILFDIVLLPLVLGRHLFIRATRPNTPAIPVPPRNAPPHHQVGRFNGQPPAPRPAPQPAPGAQPAPGRHPAAGIRLNQILPAPFRINGLTDQLLGVPYADGHLPNDNEFFRDAIERALVNNPNDEEYGQLLRNHGELDPPAEGGEEVGEVAAPRDPSVEIFQWSGANSVALYLIHKHHFPASNECPAFMAHGRAELEALSADFNRLKHPNRQNDPAAPMERNSLASVIQQIRAPQNRLPLPDNIRQIANRIIAFSQTRLTQHGAFLQTYANVYPVVNG